MLSQKNVFLSSNSHEISYIAVSNLDDHLIPLYVKRVLHSNHIYPYVQEHICMLVFNTVLHHAHQNAYYYNKLSILHYFIHSHKLCSNDFMSFAK